MDEGSKVRGKKATDIFRPVCIENNVPDLELGLHSAVNLTSQL
jgi:hypothetical protein